MLSRPLTRSTKRVARLPPSYRTAEVSRPPRTLVTRWATNFLGPCGLTHYLQCGTLIYLSNRSPRGVLLALRNSASFYKDGKIVNVDGPGMLVLDTVIDGLCLHADKN